MCIKYCTWALELSKPIDWSEITFNDGVKAHIDNFGNMMGVHCYEII